MHNPKLRKQNQVKTIQSSLSIEGNTLSEEQITSIIENKRVVGCEKDIKEVLNALDVYPYKKLRVSLWTRIYPPLYGWQWKNGEAMANFNTNE